MVWLATALGGTIRMDRCLVAVGPGSPTLMLAKGVEITPPQQATQLLQAANGPVAYNVGVTLGTFRAETISTGVITWRKALYDTRLEHGGAPFHVETVNRRPVCNLRRFLITSVGHEVHTDPGDLPTTMCIAHHVQGQFFDASRY